MDGFEVDYKKYYKVVRDVVINARLISPDYRHLPTIKLVRNVKIPEGKSATMRLCYGSIVKIHWLL